MTFDPFGDYATRGYLRNVRGAGEGAVKRLEHAAFRGELEFALEYLKSRTELTYEDVLQTHAKLFSGLYPWAGQDRTVTAPDSAIGKNGNFDLFSHPEDSRRAVETALNIAADANTMRSKPGEIMGYLACARPFLDGNGRTVMTVHAELCRRAAIHIDWLQTNKTDYLNALTKELEFYGPYRGASGIFSSQQERKDHRNAIAARSDLKGAAAQLISIAHGVRQAISDEKRQLVERSKVEIRLPDSALMDAIEKKRHLSDAQVAEIDNAIRSFEHRFGEDLGKLRTARNVEPLARKHGLDTQQITAAREVLKALDKWQSLAREQAQAIKQSQGQVRGAPTR